MRAARTAQPQKAMRQYPAFEKILELVFDKLRQARAGLGFDLGEEGLELFLHHLIERRFLRAPPNQRSRCFGIAGHVQSETPVIFSGIRIYSHRGQKRTTRKTDFFLKHKGKL